MKPLQNVGLSTDLEIARFEGLVKDRGDYLVVETPGNPSYYWGNYLIFPKEPTREDGERWTNHFRQEFAHQPLIKHIALTWDSYEPGEEIPGLSREEASILTLAPSQLNKPLHHNSALEIRPLKTDQDWEAAIQNQVACRMEGFEEAGYFVFKRAQMGKYRRMAEAGLGNWWGAFSQGKLVGDCGLYLFGELGRFQAVGTSPHHRRQGVCATLIYEVARQNPKLLVIVAELGTADRTYRSVGFTGNKSQWQLSRRPADE